MRAFSRLTTSGRSERVWLVATLLLLSVICRAQTPSLRDTSGRALTNSTLTPLYYGTGTDRLGGTRLETLDSGVVLRVTGLDSAQQRWRVRLTPTLSAFVPMTNVVTDTLSTTSSAPAPLLSGNARVWGDSAFDYVTLALPARLPYRTATDVALLRIVVDVFGVTANTNWITQLRSARAIRQVHYEQVADEQLRLFIDLNGRQHWGYSVYYVGNALTIRVRRPPARRGLRGLTIAVDAGHGGSNTGARGTTSGALEKDLTLDVALRLARLLQRSGARVVLTRSTDTLLGPQARVLAMRRAAPAYRLPQLLVSLHFNASGNGAVRGVSTYYKHAGFEPLSRAVLHQLLRMRNVVEFGQVGAFNFFFNAPTDYPNVLVEGPFLSNPADEALILNDRFRQRLARAVRRGVGRFLVAGLRRTNRRP